MIVLKPNYILGPTHETFYTMSANPRIYTKNYLMLTEDVEASLLTISELENEFLYENATRRRKKPDDSPLGSFEPVHNNVYNKQEESQLTNKGDGPVIYLRTLSKILNHQRPRVSINVPKQKQNYESVENYLKTYKPLYTYVLEDLDADWIQRFPKESEKNRIKKILPSIVLSPIQETDKKQLNISKPLLCKFRRINNITRYVSRINQILEDFKWVDDVTQYKELTTLQLKEMQVLDNLSRLIIYIDGNIEVHRLQASIGVLYEYNRFLKLLSNRVTDLKVKNKLRLYNNHTRVVLRRLVGSLPDSSKDSLLNSTEMVLKLQYSVDLDDHVRNVTFKYE